MVDPISALATASLAFEKVNSSDGRGAYGEGFVLLLAKLADLIADASSTTDESSLPCGTVVGVGSLCGEVIDNGVDGYSLDQDREAGLRNSASLEMGRQDQSLAEGTILAFLAAATYRSQPSQPGPADSERSDLDDVAQLEGENSITIPYSTREALPLLPQALDGIESAGQHMGDTQLTVSGQPAVSDERLLGELGAQSTATQNGVRSRVVVETAHPREGGTGLEVASSIVAQVGEVDVVVGSKLVPVGVPQAGNDFHPNVTSSTGERVGLFHSAVESQTLHRNDGVNLVLSNVRAVVPSQSGLAFQVRGQEAFLSREDYSQIERWRGMDTLNASAIGEVISHLPMHDTMALRVDGESTGMGGMNASLVEQIAKWTQFVVRRGRAGLSIQLEPKDLGRVRVDVTGGSEGLAVRLTAAVSDTKEIIQASLQQLRTALESQGTRIDLFEVAIESSSTGFGSMEGNVWGREAADGRPLHRYGSKDIGDAEGKERLPAGAKTSLVDYRI